MPVYGPAIEQRLDFDESKRIPFVASHVEDCLIYGLARREHCEFKL